MLFVAGGLLVLLAGCRSSGGLQPAPGAQIVEGTERVAYTSTAGVRVAADADAWPGERKVYEQVIPMQVTIENNSGRSLQLRYSAFALVTADGTQQTPLPPVKVEGVEQRVVMQTTGDLYPEFQHDGFYIAPYFAPVYPGIDIYQGSFGLDTAYYDSNYIYWSSDSPPSAQMINLAIPEGVIQDGGRITGFLYFRRHREPIKGRVQLKLNLVDAVNNNTFETASVPFQAG